MSEIIKTCLLAGGYDLNKNHGLLSEDEIVSSVEETNKRHIGIILQFVEINFKEPSKEELIQSFLKSTPLLRKIEVISLSLELNQTFIDTIVIHSVPNRKNLLETGQENCIAKQDDYFTGSTSIVTNVQPGLSPDEYSFVEYLCRFI